MLQSLFCFSETRSYSVAQVKLTTKPKLILNLSDPHASASQVLGIIESHHAGASKRHFSYFQKTKTFDLLGTAIQTCNQNTWEAGRSLQV